MSDAKEFARGVDAVLVALTDAFENLQPSVPHMVTGELMHVYAHLEPCLMKEDLKVFINKHLPFVTLNENRGLTIQ